MQETKRKELLKVLEREGNIPAKDIAVMLNLEVEEVRSEIAKLEKEKIIIKHTTLIDWEKAGEEIVSALIDVKVTPQRDVGFDEVAEKIYHFPEVKAVFLVSGGYDLSVLIEGKSLKEAALFVAEKLATIENVQSTMSHFILKRYKEAGVILNKFEEDHRQVIIP